MIDSYLRDLIGALQGIDKARLGQASDILFEAWKNQRNVYVFGNGGSWSTAEHFALDLRKWPKAKGILGLRATALTLSPLVSAYSNDHNFFESFSRQLIDLIQPGDVCIGISTSGRSPNVIAALDVAKSWGKRIGLTGKAGKITPIAGASDVLISVWAEDIRQQEDVHLSVCHILAGEMRHRIHAFYRDHPGNILSQP